MSRRTGKRDRGAMTTTDTPTNRQDPPTRRHGTPTPQLAVRLAFLWALLNLGLALLNRLGRGPAPWTPLEASVLGSLSEPTAATALAALAALSLAALGLVGPGHRGVGVRRAGGVVLIAVGLVVALGFADMRGLALIGYLPMVLLSLAGVGPVVDLDPGILATPLLSLSHTIGGLALLITGLTAVARTRGRVPSDDQTDAARRTGTALRLGRWSGAVAAAVPLLYAATRVAWAVGIPLGVRDAFLVELGDAKFAGLGLGLFAVVGVLLTLGLVQHWGEVFWHWVPRIGGRPVPVSLAVVPALFVATAVASAGLGFWRLLVVGQLDGLPGEPEDWGTWAPELVWPLWGLALGAAAFAYRARREASRSAAAG
jgi:hypothetical protein